MTNTRNMSMLKTEL